MDERKGPLHHSALHSALTDNQRAKLLQTQVPGVLVCREGREGERGGGGKEGRREGERREVWSVFISDH